MTSASNSTPLPNLQLQTAWDRFHQSVIPSDAASFNDATLDQVWEEAAKIQESHRRKGTSQNIRRLEPFIQGIEKYAKVLEVVCNGTPYISWIWVRNGHSSTDKVLSQLMLFQGANKTHAPGRQTFAKGR